MGNNQVTRLLQSFIDPVQLHRQAEFINWLVVQRDNMTQSFEEERQRWEAERESWNRMAEALLSQRVRAANSSQRDEDLERQCASYESENKHLREKVRMTGMSILRRGIFTTWCSFRIHIYVSPHSNQS